MWCTASSTASTIAVWNPATDAHLPQPYNAARLDMRSLNKIALQHRMDLEHRPDAPLFGVVSRLSSQKGLDLLLDALPALFEQGGQLALLGSGDRMLEEAFARRGARASRRGRLRFRL